MGPGFKEPGVLPQHFLPRIAGEVLKGLVHVQDATGGIGDEHAFGQLFQHGRQDRGREGGWVHVPSWCGAAWSPQGSFPVRGADALGPIPTPWQAFPRGGAGSCGAMEPSRSAGCATGSPCSLAPLLGPTARRLRTP
jgi:hypothetical protein